MKLSAQSPKATKVCYYYLPCPNDRLICRIIFIANETQVIASSHHNPPLDFSLHVCDLYASSQYPLTKMQTPYTTVYLAEEDEYVKVDIEYQKLDLIVCHGLLPAWLFAYILQAVSSPPYIQASTREQDLVCLQFRYRTLASSFPYTRRLGNLNSYLHRDRDHYTRTGSRTYPRLCER